MTPKVTIPRPTMLHFRGNSGGHQQTGLPGVGPGLHDDVAKAYGDEPKSL